jgi:uncharacterized protein
LLALLESIACNGVFASLIRGAPPALRPREVDSVLHFMRTGVLRRTSRAVSMCCVVDVLELATLSGLARVHLHAVDRPRAGLVLGHGAGGGVTAPDLVAVRDGAMAERISVALVEQPYRVAGRRSPAPAAQLDAAWIAVVAALSAGDAVPMPTLVVQGARDRFGIPPAASGRRVVEVAGDHGLKTDLQAVAAAARDWLTALLTSLEMST